MLYLYVSYLSEIETMTKYIHRDVRRKTRGDLVGVLKNRKKGEVREASPLLSDASARFKRKDFTDAVTKGVETFVPKRKK